MLKSLIGTGLEARLEPWAYAAYKEEISVFDENWKNSLHYLKSCDFTFTGGIKDSSIPTAHCQYDYHHIIYDYRACRMLDSGEPVPEGYKTMADGGSFPCAIYMLLEYFKVPTDLITIGKTLVQYGYRTENSGTLWICMDNLLEKHWGIKTKIQDSIFELCESVSLDSPVVALVPAEWLHSYPMPSNECLIIWRLEEKTAVVSTTSGHQPVKIGLYDLLAHIKRAWQCSIN